MKRLLKYTFVILFAVAVILITAILLLHFIDLNPYRERIAGLVSKGIGRQIKIEGPIDVNLFPHPQVVLNNVSLANADWGSDPVMARIGHIDAAIDFSSLFADLFIIRQVRLNDATLLLEEKDDHSANWDWVMGDTVEPKSTEEDTGPGFIEGMFWPLFVERVEFSNISFTRRAPGVTDQTASIATFTFHSQPSGEMILESSGEALEHPLSLHCTIDSKESVLDFGAVKADLKASLLDVQLTGRVSTDKLETLAGLQGNLQIDAADIHKILKMVQVEAPFNGPFTVDTTFNQNGSVLKTNMTAKVNGLTAAVQGAYEDKKMDLDLDLAPLKRAGELFDLQGLAVDTLKLKARVTQTDTGGYNIEQLEVNAGKSHLTAQGHIQGDGNVQSELSLESPDLSTLLSALPAIPLQTKASVKFAAEKITVSNLTMTSNKNNLKGEVILDQSGKNHVTADLKLKVLDLTFLDQADKPDATENTPKPKGPYIFDETPLPLPPLNVVEADVRLSVDRMDYGEKALKDVVVDATLHEGHLKTKLKFDSPVTGHAAAKIELQTKDKQAVVSTLVSLSDFRMGLIGGKEIEPKKVPAFNMTLALKTTGASPHELVSAANGQILLTSGAGKTSNSVMKMFSNDIVNQLLSALNPFAKTDNFSNWDCGAISIGIVDGRAKIKPLMIQGEKVMIVGGGSLDFGTEKLDVEFNTKPRSGVGISAGMFVSPFIKVGGTLAKPAIGLNKRGTLLTGGAAFFTGGMSFVIKSLFDRVSVEGDQCPKIKRSVGEHTPYDFQ